MSNGRPLRVRRTIAADLQRLRALPPQRRNVGYYSTMRGGYKLVGDGEGEKWAAREICTRSPRGYQAYESLTGDWYKNNPYPKDTDPPEKRAAYYDAYVKASSEWVHELPENTELWLGRIAALRHGSRSQ